MGPIDPRQLMLLQGLGRGGGGLPSPPQPMASPQLPRPQFLQGAGVYPYQLSPLQQITEGLTNFATTFGQTKQAEKKKAQEEVERDLRLMNLGVPIDQERTAKNMKKAGIHLDFETPSQQIQKAATEAPPLQVGTQDPGQIQQAGGLNMPGAVPGLNQNIGMPNASPLSIGVPGITKEVLPGYMPNQQNIVNAQPMEKQSLWDRALTGMGIKDPRINPNSAGAEWIRDYAARAKERVERGQRIEGMQSRVEEGKLGNMLGILQDDPMAIMRGERIGQAQPNATEDFIRIYREGLPGSTREQAAFALVGEKLGFRQTRAEIMKMGADMAKYFGNDLAQAQQYVRDISTKGFSELKPSFSFEERKQLSDKSDALQKTYPTADRNLTDLAAVAELTGNDRLKNSVYKALRSKDKDGIPVFPTQGQWDMYKDKVNISQAEKRIQQGWASIAETVRGHNMEQLRHIDNAFMDAAKEIRSGASKEFDQAYKIWTDKNASQEQRNSAVEMMQHAMSKAPDFEVPIHDANGKVVKSVTFAPSKYTVEDTKSFMDTITGGAWTQWGPGKRKLILSPEGKTKVTGEDGKPIAESAWEQLINDVFSGTLDRPEAREPGQGGPPAMPFGMPLDMPIPLPGGPGGGMGGGLPMIDWSQVPGAQWMHMVPRSFRGGPAPVFKRPAEEPFRE